MSLWATTETLEFSFDKLSRENDGANTAVCIYKIASPPLQYVPNTLKLYLKLTRYDKDLRLFLQKGNDIQNQTGTLFGKNSNSYIIYSEVIGTEFEVSGDEAMILTAIPNKRGDMTAFTFEYRLEGEYYPWYEWYYYQMFEVPKNGRMFLIGGGVILIVLLCIFCFCFVRCIK
jgi:hypothetical protein